MKWFAIAITLAIFVPVATYWQRPYDGPVFISRTGSVESVQDVKVTDGSLLYSWHEHVLTFKEDGGGKLHLNVNPRHRHPLVGERCRVNYREKWTYDFIGLKWRRTNVLVSIEQL